MLEVDSDAAREGPAQLAKAFTVVAAKADRKSLTDPGAGDQCC